LVIATISAVAEQRNQLDHTAFEFVNFATSKQFLSIGHRKDRTQNSITVPDKNDQMLSAGRDIVD
jgi:hypothetical protein